VVADALPLLDQTDGIIVVGRLDYTTHDAAQNLHRQIEGLHAPLLGVVANGLKQKSSAYYGYGYAADPAAAGSRSPV
jgi:Mrp family chromosome partitioning ATPase